MLAASLLPRDLMSKQLQMRAQNHLEEARFCKAAQQFEMALASYDQAKVTFKNAENARKRGTPLSELKNAFSQALTAQTPEDESLRQRIAEVYVERAEVLKSLGELGKAQKSYEKAQAWGHEAIPATSTPDVASSADRTLALVQPTAFFPSITSLTSSPQAAEACPQEKHQWAAQVFETILKQFQDLDLCQSSPSLFLVYAHNNNRLGKADAEASQRVIQWLSNLRSNLYSDRSASGHQALPFPATLEDKAKANDILSSQLCLLPNHAGTVDHVVLCASELLGHYMASPYYQVFCEAIQSAYKEASQRTNDFSQIEAAIRKVVEANLHEKEFHHVLTELAFLQIRYEYKKSEHRIIPLLLNSTAQQCLPKFIVNSTTIRIEDSKWRTPSNWKGQRYQDEGLHIAFFKLLNRLLGEKKRCIALMEEKVYRACLQKLQEDHAHSLTAEAFSLFLNQTCVTALEALKQDHGSDLRELNVQRAYESLLTEIKQIKGESLVTPDQLQLALQASYSSQRLAIQRLSGPPLSMEHCYINLAVVEHEKEKERRDEEKLKEGEAAPNYFHRLPSFEAINSNPQKLVPLEKLFEPRGLGQDKTVTLRRILIRGRAGIGKTTLSKKIVYEYMQKGQWQDRFDYLLWIPLRTLKGKQSCDLATLFYEIYFHSHPKGQALSKTLEAHINGAAKEKTLFVLDGWDEIAQEWGEHEPMFGFLKNLLNQSAVVITSRPYVDLKQVDPMDLELETVGFSPENVMAYLDNREIVSSLDTEEVKHFIQANAFLQELVNVPIQLDVLCYSWDEIKRIQEVAQGTMTVTTLYQAMINKLWRKDILRLGKLEDGKLLSAEAVYALRRASRIEQAVKTEHDFLGALAFQGLQDNSIEFDIPYVDNLIEQLEQGGAPLPLTLESHLKKLSFLHTNEAEGGQPSYHFMHLTFQEFSAAKHFVQHWEAEREITLLSANTLQWKQASPDAFVRQHKYNPRYEIFWWFVSGLLRGEALNRFFTLLEAQPRDLFGAAHQRLMMNCLYEASRVPGVGLSSTIRDRLEQGLGQWLRLEMDQTGQGTLAFVPTFPEHVLLQCLKGAASERTKKGVAHALGYRSSLSASALDALIALTKDLHSYVKCSAADALGKQSSLPASALDALIALTKAPNRDVKRSAADALGKQSSLPASALDALIALKNDPDMEVKRSAVNALYALCKQSSLPASAAFDALTALKNELDREVKRNAADVFDQHSSLSASALDALVALARGQQSSFLTSDFEALITLMKGSDSWMKRSAVNVLDQHSSLSASALDALMALTKDPDREVRGSAVNALGKQRSLPASALDALITLTKDPDWGVKRSATNVLGKQSSLPTSALDALITLTKDSDWEVRRSMADALGKYSSLPASALDALVVLTKDLHSYVKCSAADALGKQSSLPASAVDALIALTKALNREVKRSAADALGKQSSLPASALDALIALKKDLSWDVKCSAADALGKQPPLPTSALDALIALMNDPDKEVKRSVADALGKQSPLPASAVNALTTLMKDSDREVKYRAAEVLGKQSSLPASALEALAVLTKDLNWDVRYCAAVALGQQSWFSASALDALVALMKEPNWVVKRRAAMILAKHRWTLYRLLPTLNRQQIERIYTEYLLKQSFDQGIPFYIQEGSLYFYTAQGLQSVPFSDANQEAKFKQAVQQAQQVAGLPLALRDRIVQPDAQKSAEKKVLEFIKSFT